MAAHSPTLTADHHGAAAEGDLPGPAQLPGPDHGALQSRECTMPAGDTSAQQWPCQFRAPALELGTHDVLGLPSASGLWQCTGLIPESQEHWLGPGLQLGSFSGLEPIAPGT